MQRCAACKRFRFYPRPMCPHCRSFDSEWVELSGRGKIYSWIVAHAPVMPAFQYRLPMAVILVELEEDPELRLVGNTRGCANEDIRFDMRSRWCSSRSPTTSRCRSGGRAPERRYASSRGRAPFRHARVMPAAAGPTIGRVRAADGLFLGCRRYCGVSVYKAPFASSSSSRQRRKRRPVALHGVTSCVDSHAPS
jgi:uncharacterized OB-fold protein